MRRRPLEDQAAGGWVEFVRTRNFVETDPDALGLFTARLRDLEGVARVGVQALIFDGAGQAEIAAGAAHEVVRRSEYLAQDGRGRRQIDHRGPDRIVQQFTRRRCGAVRVAMGQPARLGHIFAAAFAFDLEDLGEHARARLAPGGEALRIEKIVHDDEAVAIENARGALHFMRLADLEPDDAVFLAEQFAQALHVRIVVAAAARRARIDLAGAQFRNVGTAFVVRRFVRRRGRVPADAGFAVDLQIVEVAHCRLPML